MVETKRSSDGNGDDINGGTTTTNSRDSSSNKTSSTVIPVTHSAETSAINDSIFWHQFSAPVFHSIWNENFCSPK